MRKEEILKEIYIRNGREVPKEMIKGVVESYLKIQEEILLNERRVIFGDICVLNLADVPSRKLWCDLKQTMLILPKQKKIKIVTRRYMKEQIEKRYPHEKIKKSKKKKPSK